MTASKAMAETAHEVGAQSNSDTKVAGKGQVDRFITITAQSEILEGVNPAGNAEPGDKIIVTGDVTAA